MIAVDPGIAVPDRAGEGDADAHVGRGAGDAVRLRFQAVRGQRVVAMHGRPDSGQRHAAEGDGGLQPGLDRGPGQGGDPAFQRIVGAAQGQGAQAVAVIVGVDHRRQGDAPTAPPAAVRADDPGNAATRDFQADVALRGAASGCCQQAVDEQRPGHRGVLRVMSTSCSAGSRPGAVRARGCRFRR